MKQKRLDEENIFSNLESLGAVGIPCTYARFHQPVPPGPQKEPVGEFRISADRAGAKYKVESMLYTPQGIIFCAYGVKDIVPLANVIHARLS